MKLKKKIKKFIKKNPKKTASYFKEKIEFDNYRNYVAVICLNFGYEIISPVFQLLSNSDIENITFEIIKSYSFSKEVSKKAFLDFKEKIDNNDFIIEGGSDKARELLEKTLGSEKSLEIINSLTDQLPVRPFDFIKQQSSEKIFKVLEGESNQTIALVLSHLDPIKASQILSKFDNSIKPIIALRIATLIPVSPDILREIERVLEQRLHLLPLDNSRVGGIESLVSILENIDRGNEKTIIEALEADNPELAEEIKKRMLVFEDIVLLSDETIQSILSKVDNSELSIALKSVDSEVADKIFQNMSDRAKELLKKDMSVMGPIKLKEVEKAQMKIVKIMREETDSNRYKDLEEELLI